MDGKRAAGRALFGGSFNPPHVGHLRLAIEMAETLRPLADSVELMPCAAPPHKVVSGLLPFDLRAAMVEACLDGLPGLSCNRMEAGRPGLSYTWDTLQACREETPERPLFFILGNPDYALLPHWHRGLELPELCQLVVVPRGEGSEKNFLAATESMWPGARPCEPVLPGSRRMRLPSGGPLRAPAVDRGQCLAHPPPLAARPERGFSGAQARTGAAGRPPKDRAGALAARGQNGRCLMPSGAARKLIAFFAETD